MIKKLALEAGAFDAVACEHWARGGAGAVDLGNAVIKACDQPNDFKLLYDLDLSIEEKIEIICKEIYGADGIDISDEARAQIETYTKQVSIAACV
jgi:methylenetetrahydrofolate dehydrogenase (NADP+) / methenyltetrahydrofolate cyclohydrolase / formyltetrahydrofolate synthetase